MTSKNYRPSMKPEVIPAHEVGGVQVPAQIKISREYGVSLRLSEPEQRTLQDFLLGRAICPALFWFRDTKRVRELLKVDRPDPISPDSVLQKDESLDVE